MKKIKSSIYYFFKSSNILATTISSQVTTEIFDILAFLFSASNFHARVLFFFSWTARASFTFSWVFSLSSFRTKGCFDQLYGIIRFHVSSSHGKTVVFHLTFRTKPFCVSGINSL